MGRSVESSIPGDDSNPIAGPHGADAHARLKGSCGDTMEYFIMIESGTITEVHHATDGCGTSIACLCRLSRMIRGITVVDAMDITPRKLIDDFDDLPPSDHHCAQLAVETMKTALLDHLENNPP